MKAIVVRVLMFCGFVYLSTFPLYGDELWDKAIDIFERSKADAQPKTMRILYEELKKNGSVDETKEIYTKIVPNEGGGTKSELLKVLHNGKDVTEEEIKKEKEGKKSGQSMTLRGDLFDKTKQDTVVYTRLDETEDIDGRTYAIYSFTHTVSQKERYTGKVWIDNTEGIPLKTEFTMNPLPSKVKKMDISVRYEVQNGILRFKSVAFNVHASFLIISKRIRTFMEFGY